MGRGEAIGLESEVLRERGVAFLDEDSADRLARRLAHRFIEVQQKLKGGTLTGGPQGGPGPNPAVQNQWGGKCIIKYNPSQSEIQSGIRQEVSLLVWQSPDGLPHFVTIEVGRLTNGIGGPTNDSQFIASNNASVQGIGGGTFPLGIDLATNAPLSYRACAQVVLGTPGTMQDPFFIDINRGQRFTALASYVAITAQMDPPPVNQTAFQGNGKPSIGPNGVDYISGSMAVYATLGMGVAPSLTPPLFTQYIDTNSTGQAGILVLSFNRIIPPRANFLLPILGSAAANGITLNFFDNAGNVIGTPPVYNNTTANASYLPIPIPQDAYVVNVNPSTSGKGLFFWRLIYQLSV